MPRKPRSTSKQTENKLEIEQGTFWLPNDAAWGGFINIRIDDHDKLLFEEWSSNNAQQGIEILDDLMGQGVKLGFSYDRENACYIATLTGALVVGSNERYCVTSRAGSLVDVIQLAAFKHVVIADGDYGSFRPSTGRMNNFG